MRTRQTISVCAILMLAVVLLTSQAAAQGAFSVPKEVRTIFNDSCVSCHGGKTPSAGHSYATDADLQKLLGMPSSEKSSVDMIDPGNPAKSYLVMKIKGSSGIVGSRMPLAGKDLTAAQVKVIEDWISGMSTKAGASSSAGSSAGSAPAAGSSAGSTAKDPAGEPGGTMMKPASPMMQASPASGAPKSMPKPMATDMFDGEFVFMQKCADCHGASGEGVFLFGVPLSGNAFIKTGTDEAIGEVINMGRKYQDIHYPDYEGMPKFQFITGGELKALIDYLKGPLQG
jgi:mono/diheme cytochrome c family protein